MNQLRLIVDAWGDMRARSRVGRAQRKGDTYAGNVVNAVVHGGIAVLLGRYAWRSRP